MDFIYSKALNSFLATETAGLKKGTKKRLKTLYRNCYIFNITVNRLINVYMSTYGIRAKTPWGSDSKKLPPGMSERVIKMSFLMNACAAFLIGVNYNGEYYPGKYAFYAYPSGKGYNFNGDPLSCNVMSMYNGLIQNEVPLYISGETDEELLKLGYGYFETEQPRGFLVWENEARFPMIYTILYYALKITQAYMTLDTTMFWLNVPVVFTGDKSIVNSIDEMVEKIANREAYTIQAGAVGDVGQATNIMNTNVNGQSLKDVTALIEWLESKIREEYGIDSNPQMDKKGENLQTAEITVNNEYQSLRSYSRIDTMNEGFKAGKEWSDFGIELEAYSKVGHNNMSSMDQKEGVNNDNGLRDIRDVDQRSE